MAADVVKSAGGPALTVASTLLALHRVSAFIFDMLNKFQEWRLRGLRYELAIREIASFDGAVEHAKQLKASQTSIADGLCKSLCKDLVDAHGQDAPPEVKAESRNACVNAMFELQKLIDQGTVVDKAFNAPAAVKAALPAPITSEPSAQNVLPATAQTSDMDKPGDSKLPQPL